MAVITKIPNDERNQAFYAAIESTPGVAATSGFYRVNGRLDIPVGSPPLADSDGWYAVGGWRVTPSLMSVVRYDTFLENSSESASRQTNYTAGVVWQPVKYLRCQLNYTYEDYASRAAANRNVVSLMLSGIF